MPGVDIETQGTTDVQGVEQEIIDQVLADEGEGKGAGEGGEGAGQQITTPVAKTAPKTEPAAAPKNVPPGMVPYDALHAERLQRQQLQQQLTQVLQKLTEQQQRPPVTGPDPNADPLAAMIAQQLEKVMPQFTAPMQQMQQRFEEMQQKQAFQQRVIQSDNMARAKHADYDEVIGPIKQRAQMDPNFARTLLSMPDPGEYAYIIGLGMQAQTQRMATGEGQVTKLQQMAAMPRSSQIQSGGGGTTSQFANLDDMVDHFDQLTPAQQDRLLKMATL